MEALPALQETHQTWIEGCFSGKQPEGWKKSPEMIAYDLVWHNKFPFLQVANGDMVVIDLADPSKQPVVYLSHEGGACHGYRLGNDFEDYASRLTEIAFVGAEEWSQELFLIDPTSGLQTDGANVRAWRDWLNT